MIDFLYNIAIHPYAIFIAAVSLVAAVSFLIFFWGFSGYLLAYGDKEHQQNARVQMIQGLSLFVVVFCAWEIIRGGLVLWYGSPLPTLTILILLAIAITWLVRTVKKLFSSPKGGH